MALECSKAFLCGDMQTRVFIELPDEDARKDGKKFVGLPRKWMYVLRDALLIWQRVVKEMHQKRGFTSLVTTQCMYVNRLNGVITVAHVDDFLCFGDKMLLPEFLADLQKEYECSGDVLGPEEDEIKEWKFLGRTFLYKSSGLEWVEDRKHAKAYLQKLALGNLKPVETL